MEMDGNPVILRKLDLTHIDSGAAFLSEKKQKSVTEDT